jgi:hypothetical protein
MKTSQGSISPSPISTIVLATASLVAAACGREMESTPPPESTTSLTSAEVAAAAPENLDESSCESPMGDPGGACECVRPATAELALPPAVRATMPVMPEPNRSLAFAALHARARSRRALDEAIARVVDSEDHANATARAAEPIAAETVGTTPPAPTRIDPDVGRASLTGAPLSRPQAEPALRPARVTFDNHLPDDYQLERVRVFVDGAVSYDGRSAATLEIPPGAHVVKVVADYRLSDPVFTYVRGYHMEIQSTEVVPASSAPIAFVATAVPAGGVTTPINKRAALTWRSRAGW